MNRYQLPDAPRARGDLLPERNLLDTGNSQRLLTHEVFPGISTNLCSILARPLPGQIERFILRTPKYPTRTVDESRDLANDVRGGGGLPDITESPILDVIHNFDSPCSWEGRSRDCAPESEE